MNNEPVQRQSCHSHYNGGRGFLSSTSVIVAVLMSYGKALLNKPTLWPSSESIVQPSVKAPCVIRALGRLSHFGKFACSPSLVNMAKSKFEEERVCFIFTACSLS